MKTPNFIQLHHEYLRSDCDELLRGLTENPAKKGAYTAPKYLYDALGSKLFEAICELPEYYPTRTEAGIFLEHARSMAALIPQGAVLIDLGAGNCKKAAGLFASFKPARYLAVDISVDFLRITLGDLQRHYPALDMVGVGMDFSNNLDLPIEALGDSATPRVFFYPGSSIGNFAPEEALAFMQRIHAACFATGARSQQGGVLVGVDLVKGKAELEAAYDDALGVTAAFNRNVLLHINQLIEGDFNPCDWSHVALYDEQLARIEMHLQANQDVPLHWAGGGRLFRKGERIHTECSYKWTTQGFSQLLQNAGFAKPVIWADANCRFAVMWAGA